MSAKSESIKQARAMAGDRDPLHHRSEVDADAERLFGQLDDHRRLAVPDGETRVDNGRHGSPKSVPFALVVTNAVTA